MRYSVIDLNTCNKHAFRKRIVLNMTSNPIISLVKPIGYDASMQLTNSFYISTMNCLKPSYTTTTTNSGLTIEPNPDGSYHIYGTTSSSPSASIQLYTLQKNGIEDGMNVTLNTSMDTSNNSNEWPTITVNTSTETIISNDTEISLFDIPPSTWTYVYLKPVRNAVYDFTIKVWTLFPDYLEHTSGLSPTPYYSYVEPQLISPPVTDTNGVGYNMLVPRKFLNMPVLLYTASALFQRQGYELYYNPDYIFDYHTITEDMDRLDIPAYVRPFSGTLGSSYSYIRLPDYPVKGIRYAIWYASNYTNITGNVSRGDFDTLDLCAMFDREINYSSDIKYSSNGYKETNSPYHSYTVSPQPQSGQVFKYEWILGDPPLELAED